MKNTIKWLWLIALAAITALVVTACDDNVFIHVTSITGVPKSGIVGTALALNGTVNPGDATNKTIVWSKGPPHKWASGATLNGNSLSVNAEAVVTLMATIADGRGRGAEYWQEFTITFNDSFDTSSAIKLSADTWADGNIASAGEQWFKFTASAAEQYVHFSSGSLTDTYVRVYNKDGVWVGSQERLYVSRRSSSRTLTPGQEYYIRVRPYSSGNSGTYRICFNALPVPPGAWPPPAGQLSADTWADGNISASTGEQWFKFTATADTQYVHFYSSFFYSDFYVRIYDSGGAAVGNGARLYENLFPVRYASWTLTPGREYYIWVRPNSSGYSGTYRIGFNAITFPPGAWPPTAAQLVPDTWADGNPASSGKQWFRFTATAATQYIHASFGTLADIYVQLCVIVPKISLEYIEEIIIDKIRKRVYFFIKGETYMEKQRMKPFLTFNGQAEEVLNYYASIFPEAKITKLVRYGKNLPHIRETTKIGSCRVLFRCLGRKFYFWIWIPQMCVLLLIGLSLFILIAKMNLSLIQFLLLLPKTEK